MPKNSTRSDVWNYFTKIDHEKASCNMCKHLMSYKTTISNLKGHLKRKHVADFVAMTSVNLQQERVDENELNNNRSSTEQPAQNIIVLPSTSTNIGQTGPKRQRLMGSYTYSIKKISLEEKNKIDRDLLDLFIKDLQPFSVVEDAGFSKLMKWIPGYELPGRKAISSVMIPALYHKSVDYLKETVQKQAETICITTDCWTSSITESYIAVTAHYITEDFKFKSILLKCSRLAERHTANNLAAALKDVIADWNIHGKINFAVSDNASNITCALDILKWKHYGCYAHKLNLIVQNSLGEFMPTIEKIKKIVAHFRRSSLANEKLMKYQLSTGNPLAKSLILDVPTRWNSTFYMLRRFVELEESLRATLALLDHDLPTINSDDWQTSKYLVDILLPFEEMTSSMSGEKFLTGSSVIVVTRCLKGACIKFEKKYEKDPRILNFIKLLKSGIEERFRNIEFSTTFSLCTLLDPRYKSHVFEDQQALEKCKKALRDLVLDNIEKKEIVEIYPSTSKESQPTIPSSSSAWCIFDDIMADVRPQTNALSRAIMEIDRYFKDDILPRLNIDGKPNCPLDWWRKHQHIYPNLASIMKQKCNIVATSVPCERIFSKAGNLINERRTSLRSKKVEMIMFLNGNSKEID